MATIILVKRIEKWLMSFRPNFEFRRTNYKHTDDFDIWKWSKQAFSFTGYLLGWTGFQETTKAYYH
jgi:hypothetical protein